MPPLLDYTSSDSVPQGVVLQEELETMQKHVAWIVTENYNYKCMLPTKKKSIDKRLILLYTKGKIVKSDYQQMT